MSKRDGSAASPLPNPSIHPRGRGTTLRHRKGTQDRHASPSHLDPMRKGFCRPPSKIFPCTLELDVASDFCSIGVKSSQNGKSFPAKASPAGRHGIIALVTIIELKCARSLRSGPSGQEGRLDGRTSARFHFRHQPRVSPTAPPLHFSWTRTCAVESMRPSRLLGKKGGRLG